MQVKCIRPFGGLKVGELAEVPDGTKVDPHHFEPLTADPAPDPPAPPAAEEPAAAVPVPAGFPHAASHMHPGFPPAKEA